MHRATASKRHGPHDMKETRGGGSSISVPDALQSFLCGRFGVPTNSADVRSSISAVSGEVDHRLTIQYNLDAFIGKARGGRKTNILSKCPDVETTVKQGVHSSASLLPGGSGDKYCGGRSHGINEGYLKL